MRVGLGLAAVGFATLATNIAAGYRESSQLNKELALSGNIAGTSLGQINAGAQQIARSTGASIGFVREVLAEVVKLSGQTGDTITGTGRAAAAVALITGQSAAEAVNNGLRRGEVAAILEEGEEVLTANNPRHSKNYRAGSLIGNLNISVSVNGASGSEDDAERARLLAEGMRSVVVQYVAEQMRQGGVFSKR